MRSSISHGTEYTKGRFLQRFSNCITFAFTCRSMPSFRAHCYVTYLVSNLPVVESSDASRHRIAGWKFCKESPRKEKIQAGEGRGHVTGYTCSGFTDATSLKGK